MMILNFSFDQIKMNIYKVLKLYLFLRFLLHALGGQEETCTPEETFYINFI